MLKNECLISIKRLQDLSVVLIDDTKLAHSNNKKINYIGELLKYEGELLKSSREQKERLGKTNQNAVELTNYLDRPNQSEGYWVIVEKNVEKTWEKKWVRAHEQKVFAVWI